MDANRAETGRLGVLVVGVGFLGSSRALAAQAAKNTRLIAVHDANATQAYILSQRLNVLAVDSLDEGLANPDVDIVIVATPHADHDEVIRHALDAGKTVLCEKPLAIDADDARDLAEKADSLGLRLATGFNHRFYPPVAEALRLLSSWAIGRVESVRMTIGHVATPEFLEGWHADRAVSGGGTLMDNGVHACELEDDCDTGEIQILGYWGVDDIGTVINPMIVEGQIQGGIAQGLGQAMSEHCFYDPECGQLLSG